MVAVGVFLLLLGVTVLIGITAVVTASGHLLVGGVLIAWTSVVAAVGLVMVAALGRRPRAVRGTATITPDRRSRVGE